MAKQFLITFLLMAYLMGAIGGLGYAIWNGDPWPIVVSMVVLVLMGLPTAWRLFNEWKR